ncbi:MAG: hypothetical protein JO072_08430 [Parafilimonas sp.]|nr:hypothetical protein [Parafilimonas sp.]
MAQTPSGILGAIDGSVGTVTGSRWKETTYIRLRNRKRRGTSSAKQIDVQLRFILVQRFLQTMNSLLKLTFKKYAAEMTEFNAAFSYNFHNAITGRTPDYEIDFTKALVSRGELPNAIAPAATAEGAVVYFRWEDNTGSNTAKATDNAVMVVYCKNLNQTIYTTNVGTRADKAAQINAASFKGETVETWLAFLSEDGAEASNSLFTGELSL